MTTTDETTEVYSTPDAVHIGQQLLEARQSQGLSLSDVANKLKLSKRQIDAIENNRFSELPGNTFVRGFVRNYARLLEVPVEPLMAQLELVLPKSEAVPVLPSLRDAAQPLPLEGKPFWMSIQFALVVLGVTVVSVVAVFWFFTAGKSEPELSVPTVQAPPLAPPVAPVSPPVFPPESTSSGEPTVVPPQEGGVQIEAPTVTPPLPLPESKPVAPTVTAPPSGASAGSVNVSPVTPMSVVKAMPATMAAAPSVVANEVKIAAVAEDTWVLLTDATGNKLINSVVKAGSDRVVTGTPPFKMVVGNAGKTRVYYKGVETPLAPFTKSNVATLDLK